MHRQRSSPESTGPAGLLRRSEQIASGFLVLAALGMVAAWWVSRGGPQGRLIELDRSPRRSAEFQVDLNRAEWPELAQLPGIGETLARRIVDSRRAEGPFVDHEDLRRVRGIGPKTLDRLRPYLLPVPGASNLAGR